MMKNLRPLWPYLWRYRGAFLAGFCALALKDLAAVAAPLIIRGAVDRFSHGAPAAQIWRFAGYLVCAAILRGIFQPKASDDARAYAARCLGALGDAAGVEPLAEIVSGDHPARLVRESAVALRALGNPAAADALARAVAAWGAEYGKRLQGGGIDYPDWETVCATLADVLEAYAVCGPASTAASHVEKNAVRLVLEKREPIHAEARAGQDPSRPRTRLAGAVARAYATLAAPEAMFTTLQNAVRGDASAGAAIDAGRAEPFSRPAPPPAR